MEQLKIGTFTNRNHFIIRSGIIVLGTYLIYNTKGYELALVFFGSLSIMNLITISYKGVILEETGMRFIDNQTYRDQLLGLLFNRSKETKVSYNIENLEIIVVDDTKLSPVDIKPKRVYLNFNLDGKAYKRIKLDLKSTEKLDTFLKLFQSKDVKLLGDTIKN